MSVRDLGNRTDGADGTDSSGVGGLWPMETLAVRWCVSPRTARRLCAQRGVPVIRLSGRVVLVRPGDVEAAEAGAEVSGTTRRSGSRGFDGLMRRLSGARAGQ
jgi:hypothetical protein